MNKSQESAGNHRLCRFSNFDIKYDVRDNRYKFFEINTRQGRSNYYVTGSGFNVARYFVEEFVYNKEIPFEIAKEEASLDGCNQKPLPANMYTSQKTKRI